MLTLHKDTLYIDWPFGVKENITILETGQVWEARRIDWNKSEEGFWSNWLLFRQAFIEKEYLHLEPIGIILVFFFFAIILIQVMISNEKVLNVIIRKVLIYSLLLCYFIDLEHCHIY